MKAISRILTISMCLFSLSLSAQMDQDALKPFKDQQILDDLIVDGSACVGQDCVNGESFGFDTHRYKENNLRIHFNDTSNSASFPTNDWRIVINDSSNGGANYFGIEDASAARMPFRVEAGAPAHSLYVEDGGRIGLGTSTPVVELHVVDGDSPTLRLEQDGSSGFTAQTWDVAGNETNFFVRDATNGSRLPFKIRPSAPTNSLYIDTDGDVGLGDASPDGAFDIVGDSNRKIFQVDNDGSVVIYNNNGSLVVQSETLYGLTTKKYDDIDVFGALFGPNQNAGASIHAMDSSGNGRFTSRFGLKVNSMGVPRGVMDIIIRNSSGNVTSNIEALSYTPGGNVGIGTTSPSTILEIDGDATKPGGGSWSAPSDKRLKKNIKEYSEGLDKILSFNPVTYQYNGKGGISDTEKVHVGLIAQEAQEVASYMVSNVERGTTVKNGDEESTTYEDYLMLDPSAIPYMLINAIKEQQAQMDAKDEKIENLESKIDKLELALNSLIDRINGDDLGNNNSDILNEDDVVLSMASLPYLRQNVPNPYDNETSIDYFVPETAQNVTINFFDNQGKLLKSQVISQRGEGKLNVRNEDLPSGTYVYSLIIDGQMISSKKMSVK